MFKSFEKEILRNRKRTVSEWVNYQWQWCCNAVPTDCCGGGTDVMTLV
jgi:hypothetical protein